MNAAEHRNPAGDGTFYTDEQLSIAVRLDREFVAVVEALGLPSYSTVVCDLVADMSRATGRTFPSIYDALHTGRAWIYRVGTTVATEANARHMARMANEE